MHKLQWDKLVEKKTGGGLGFRDLEAHNLALLAKQGWKFLPRGSSLLYRVL